MNDRAFPNPNYLMKDELIYEITIREAGSEIHTSALDSNEPQGELRTLRNKFNEIQEVVADVWADITPNQYVRIMTRVRHLTYRTRNLVDRKILDQSNTASQDELSVDISYLMSAMEEFQNHQIKRSEDSIRKSRSLDRSYYLWLFQSPCFTSRSS